MVDRVIEVARTVRFSIPLTAHAGATARGPRSNTFAGWPSADVLAVFYAIDVVCRGTADPRTGYLIGIREIDEAVREYVLPLLERAVRSPARAEPPELLRQIVLALRPPLGDLLWRVHWHLTPTYGLSMMNESTERVLISQQFEFAAAHRLHCGELSEEENRRIFGKCNNPSGHGHNYRVEVTAATRLPGNGHPPTPTAPPTLTLAQLERIVDEQIVERFDHTNLNLDVDDFREKNPSVEHITRRCYDLLQAPVAEAGGELARVTVWETEKTSCTYPVPAP